MSKKLIVVVGANGRQGQAVLHLDHVVDIADARGLLARVDRREDTAGAGQTGAVATANLSQGGFVVANHRSHERTPQTQPAPQARDLGNPRHSRRRSGHAPAPASPP